MAPAKASVQTRAGEPSTVTALARVVSQPVRIDSTTSWAVTSPGVGPGSSPTITV